MSNAPESGLALESVVRRFGDAEKALDGIRARLGSLTDSAERSEAAAGGLTEAAESVRSFTSAAGELAAELQAAVVEARNVFEKSGDLLGGNALDSLQRSVADLAQLVGERLDAIESRVQRIEQVWQALPSRWRNRAKP